jgi:DNA segregation ATPase FtsK/SpoIIIE-like protein
VQPKNRNHVTREEADKQAKVIVKQFERRGIQVALVEAVSTYRINSFFYELQDGDTSRIARIDETLQRMLEMALGVSGVCIAAPARNESLISVEVPRDADGDPVHLAPFVERARASELRLPCPLGEDSRGRIQLIDLARD